MIGSPSASMNWGAAYVPSNGSESDVSVLYIHGGGWCVCDQITHRSVMTDLAALSGLRLYGLSYPLAPENPYPAAFDVLCEKIVRFTETSGHRIVLAGDSAGANLALATALHFRDKGGKVPIDALLLWYGCYRYRFDTRSHRLYGDGSNGLATDVMRQMWGDYLAQGADTSYADLTEADMSGLPPSYICEAECDCLADDTRWLASRFVESWRAAFL